MRHNINDQRRLEYLSQTSAKLERRFGGAKFKADEVLEVVCEVTGVKKEDLEGRFRATHIVDPRHLAAYALNQYSDLGLTSTEIGRILGGRDHTTILSSIANVRYAMASFPSVNGSLNNNGFEEPCEPI